MSDKRQRKEVLAGHMYVLIKDLHEFLALELIGAMPEVFKFKGREQFVKQMKEIIEAVEAGDDK